VSAAAGTLHVTAATVAMLANAAIRVILFIATPSNDSFSILILPLRL
jgi:hypothetical protein